MMSSDQDDLHRAVIEALEPAALNCHSQDCGSLEWDDIVRVSEYDVTQSSWCQAKVAAPAEPFAADIFKTFQAIALRAVKHLKGSSNPTAAVSTVMKDSQNANDWIGGYLRASPLSVRIQTATRAVSWLTRTTELLGTDDLSGYRFDQKFDWKYPGYGLMLRSKVVLVQPAGAESAPVLVTTSPSKAWDDSVAFSLLLWKLVAKRSTEHAIVLVHSTGDRLDLKIDSLLQRGIDAASHAALAVSQRDVGPGGLERSPSYFTCQSCAWRDSCDERVESEGRPPVRGGVRLG